MTPWLPSWPTLLQALCLGHKPKARVTTDDLNQVPEGRVHRNHYFHLLINSRDNLVRRVVAFIFRGIIHMRVVDGLWLMDFSQHKFNVIIVAGLAIIVSVVLTFTQS